jgi:hypothetical protein
MHTPAAPSVVVARAVQEEAPKAEDAQEAGGRLKVAMAEGKPAEEVHTEGAAMMEGA